MKNQILKAKHGAQLGNGLMKIFFGGMIAVVCGCQSASDQLQDVSVGDTSRVVFKENIQNEISNEVLQQKKQLKDKIDAEWYSVDVEEAPTYEPLSADEYKRIIMENPVKQEQCAAQLITLAKAGDGKAMGVLGEIFLWDGDYDKAAYWSNMAVEKVDGLGFAVRGVLMREGRGGYVKSEKDAYICFQRSAELGCAMGVCQLGLSHEMGWGCERSAEKAVDFYRKAAELGCGEAMYRLGWCYLHGIVVEESKLKAGEWFLKSANEKCVNGMTALALSYMSGWGVPKDEEQVEKLLNEASGMEHNDWALREAGDYYFGKSKGKLNPYHLDPYDFDTEIRKKALGYYNRYARTQAPDRDYVMFKVQKIVMELVGKENRMPNEIMLADEKLAVVNDAIAELMKLTDSKNEWVSCQSSLELARIFDKGRYGKKNLMEALKWYEKASASGDEDAVIEFKHFEQRVFDETTIKERMKSRRKRTKEGSVEVNWSVHHLMQNPYWPVRGSSLWDNEVVKDGEIVGLFGICLGQDGSSLKSPRVRRGNSFMRSFYRAKKRYISWGEILFDVLDPVRFDGENPVIGVMAERRFDSERCAMSAAEDLRTAIKERHGIVIEVDPSVKDACGWIRILKQKAGDVSLALKVEKRDYYWYLVYSLKRCLEDAKNTNSCEKSQGTQGSQGAQAENAKDTNCYEKRLMTLLAREGGEIVGMFGVRLGQDVSSLTREMIGEFLGNPTLLPKKDGGGMMRRYAYKGNRGVWDSFSFETSEDQRTVRKIIAKKEYQDEAPAQSDAAEFRDLLERKYGVLLNKAPLAENAWLQIFLQERNTVILEQKIEKVGGRYVLSYSMSGLLNKNVGE